MTPKPLKIAEIILLIVVIVGAGIIIPKFLIKDKISLNDKERQESCADNDDPIIAVQAHFDNPFENLLTFKTIIESKEKNTILIVGGYTFFGIKITEASFSCQGIMTLKQII